MKKKYVVEVRQENTMHAGTKAKQDITNILTKNGFLKLGIEIPKHKLVRAIKGNLLWKKELEQTNPGDYIFYQYPAYSRILSDSFIKYANQKKLTKVLIIHDVDSLRFYIDSFADCKREIKFFNQFEFIIAHNKSMKGWLINHGVKKEIIELELFDYLSEITEDQLIREENKAIVFAGNLAKSNFLVDLRTRVPLLLYGVDPADEYHSNISYQGAFPPDELEKRMVGSKYGLVWDGKSLITCSGISGEYMRYNNPHKVSLYLSLGIPVIIWKKAALADFILREGVGITIENLENIDQLLLQVSEQEYKDMKQRAIKISRKIRNGELTQAAVKKVLELY